MEIIKKILVFKKQLNAPHISFTNKKNGYTANAA